MRFSIFRKLPLSVFATCALPFAVFAAAGGTLTALNVESLLDQDVRTPETSIRDYDVRGIDWDRETRELEASHGDGDCGEPGLDTDPKSVFDGIGRYYEQPALAKALHGLERAGRIARVIAVADGSDGDSEYCSQATVRIYSKDGEALTLSFDYNT